MVCLHLDKCRYDANRPSHLNLASGVRLASHNAISETLVQYADYAPVDVAHTTEDFRDPRFTGSKSGLANEYPGATMRVL